MSTDRVPANASRSSLRLADREGEAEQPKSTLPRQFVTFTFYRVRPEWRLLPEAEREAGKREFLEVLGDYRGQLMIHTYSITGLRSNADLMIWRIGYKLDPFQEMSARLNRTGLGRYLEATQTFLSMTKRSMYIDKDHPEHVDSAHGRGRNHRGRLLRLPFQVATATG